MTIHCDVFLRDSATPAQLTAVGGAFWRWCTATAGNGVYPFLDNQTLADLIAGELPNSGVHFRVRDEVSQNRQATIESLRREIPVAALADIVVDGMSWTSDPSARKRLVESSKRNGFAGAER
jgi:hypothetical protein